MLWCELLHLFLLWSFSYIIVPLPSLNFNEKFLSLFCLATVLLLRPFKWTLYAHKYKYWEYVMTLQVFTLRLQSKPECQSILLYLVNRTNSLSGDAAQPHYPPPTTSATNNPHSSIPDPFDTIISLWFSVALVS